MGAAKACFDSALAYSRIHNTLVLVEEPVDLKQADAVKKAVAVIGGQAQAPVAGAAVFTWLQVQVPPYAAPSA